MNGVSSTRRPSQRNSHAARRPGGFFFTETGFTGPRPGVAANPNRLVRNDTQLLYDSLRQSGGISIPHTTGSFAGTDWRDNDPDVEPLVDLYQGARLFYETPGAPRAARGPDEIRDFREPGFVWNAYRKGYRLGTIASSDHWSTHISYAMVFTEQPNREAIFDAIKKRRTYGATDNIILDCRMGEHFMGEESQTRACRRSVSGFPEQLPCPGLTSSRTKRSSTPRVRTRKRSPLLIGTRIPPREPATTM